MSGERSGENKWMAGISLMIVAPVLVLAAAVFVVVLSTPVMMALIVVAFATALLAAGTAVTMQAPASEETAKEGPMCEPADLIATLEPETIEMVEDLADAPRSPVTASITKVYGPCPLDLMPGNTWEIGPDGGLSRPMCRPGATALSSLFRMANGDVMGQSACCECVIARREVTFTVREPVAETVETRWR